MKKVDKEGSNDTGADEESERRGRCVMTLVATRRLPVYEWRAPAEKSPGKERVLCLWRDWRSNDWCLLLAVFDLAQVCKRIAQTADSSPYVQM